MIQYVKEFESQLEINTLGQMRIFDQGGIDVEEAGPRKRFGFSLPSWPNVGAEELVGREIPPK